ncbi:DNA-binding transcriptional MerR regulator [Saccharothrix coeruleofusca]|uniref:MerR family transcriptional regulator n=1 Tax=Saccharothrix coeruleofusca TaxID=33919 RepID=UPI001AE42A60|nr:MerR family transcriptional regulator [Saccharothrix coeruleofusca]MBP2338198.1 DNA-binding transcriptional MerR regulator [Saccharothrix coeruleofusca]
MRIGELAARAGVSVRSLRYYEQQGLLTSERSSGGQRLYRESDVERVVLFQRLYSAGLSSRTIAEIMPCVDAGTADVTDAAWESMARERERLDTHITELLRARDTLDEVMTANRRHRAALAGHAEREEVACGR